MALLTLLILLVLALLLAYIIYKPPHLLISLLQWKNPDVLWHVPLPSSSRVVALTIDDAPSDQTAKMLDLLKVYGAKATFFVIGSQIAAHPHLLQRMHDEGHEIGNHAWKDEPSVSLPLSELERQIKEVESLIPPNLGSAKYFRPGSGFFNKKMVDRVMGLGYRVVLGSIYPHDPQIHNPVRNSKHVLSMLRPGGIIIMHDRRSYSAEQLELILRGMATKEWKAESLGGLLKVADEVKGKKGG
jgi:peptidoglycan/xylan/chitin deacetylase (PgdA/CDA1 family)